MEPPRTPSASATGTIRNKVGLKPGHSLMDWIKLCKSGKDLTGFGGVLQAVTLEELSKHSHKNDAWIAIRGNVYNVTHYIDFHPGGERELMKGVGRDATDLFDQIHHWVNVETMLEKCLIGRLKKGSLINPDEFESTSSKKSSTGTVVSGIDFVKLRENSLSQKSPPPLRTDWFQKCDSLTLNFYARYPVTRVSTHLASSKDLKVYISLNKKHYLFRVFLDDIVLWPCKMIKHPATNKIEIILTKNHEKLWKTLGNIDGAEEFKCITMEQMQESCTMELIDIHEVTHDTKFLILKFAEKRLVLVNPGQHIEVKMKVQGMDVVRPYTPVPPCLHKDFLPEVWVPECMCLMIKQYPSGVLSKRLCNKKPGHMISITGPFGNLVIPRTASRLHLIAAGTGVTPMLSIIASSFEPNSKINNVSLLFYNRTESDILWKEQLDKLQSTETRFKVEYVLSEADKHWTGAVGIINKEKLQEFLADFQKNKSYLCCCGPPGFTGLCKMYIAELQYKPDEYYIFP